MVWKMTIRRDNVMIGIVDHFDCENDDTAN